MYHLASFAISFIFCLALVPAVIKISKKYSLLDYPLLHKRHSKPTPNLGGTAVLISVWAGIFLYFVLSGEILADIKPYLPYIIIGSLIIYGLGVVDDIRALSAWAKLLGQIAVALVLYAGGLTVELLSIPFYGTISLDGWGMLITVLWVVALTNAINLMDGLDGLASGVSVIAAASMTVIGLMYQVTTATLISITLMGALFGFWFYNKYPAKIFLGDCGSLLIGYFFAVLSLLIPIKSFTTAALFVPLVVLGVPLTEAVSSFIRRLVAGKSVMKADRRHIFHYLSFMGLSQRQIVTLFYVSGLFFGGLSIAMSLYRQSLVLTILVLFMVVIFILYFIFISRIKKAKLER